MAAADKPGALTKSELVARIARDHPDLEPSAVDYAVGALLDRMAAGLAGGERVEIRGFGSLSLRHRPARAGRNPKTGDAVQVAAKWATHFKPGANLRARVNRAAKAAADKPARKKPPRKKSAKSAGPAKSAAKPAS